jgi:hypothetical protein
MFAADMSYRQNGFLLFQDTDNLRFVNGCCSIWFPHFEILEKDFTLKTDGFTGVGQCIGVAGVLLASEER